MRFIIPALLFFCSQLHAQQNSGSAAKKWADSVYQSLNPDERIGQLIVTRLSSMDVKTKKITFLFDQAADLVKKYNIGGICIFQGSPVLQAGYLNALQSMAKTPMLVSIDAEWGLGMRIIDSVLPLPRQMMLGAVSDAAVIYRYGQIVAAQCKRMGIHQNYAPVADVNNNPDNPVINDRSFGEDKYKVALYSTQYMKGMQDMGVMACAKHFPGHGDVNVDSHYDLPVINKTLAELDSMELYPFRALFNEGIQSVMVAHLAIPSIDSRPNRPSSLSGNNINGLLRNTLGYGGLTITDGLEMQGVKKFFPDGESSVESLIAGNDLLCLPDNIPLVIQKIKEAISRKRLSWKDIETHGKKVLMAKYRFAFNARVPVDTENLTADLNKDVPGMRKLVAENAITLLSGKDSGFFPLHVADTRKGDVAYVAIGINSDNAVCNRMRSDYGAHVFYFDYNKKDADSVNLMIDSIVLCFKKVVIGIHQINRAPANNFGISNDAVSFINILQQRARAITLLFGNAYAAKNWCFAKNLVVCYEDDSIVQHTAVDILQGKINYKGKLPVSICENFLFGSGIVSTPKKLENTNPATAGFDTAKLTAIDSIVADAMAKKAMPGCVVLVAKDGKIALQKAYGHYTYEEAETVNTSSVYDIASITKILATTISLMKLYDEGKIDLKKNIGEYLPALKGSNKAAITLEMLLLHEAGLAAFTPFYKETLDNNGFPKTGLYSTVLNDSFNSRVAGKLFLRNDLPDSFFSRIINSPVNEYGKYVYSDNDFILLGKIVEAVSGMGLDEYVKKHFYDPMELETIGYQPNNRITQNRIVPSLLEPSFRMQLLKGDVHDPGAAILGGVAGHAGLFSDAYDMACIMQMLLNGGELAGKKYLDKNTIDSFTSYQRLASRRGLGFDKPEKDNSSRPEPYPALSASPATFGHLGFTGTCAWADPEKKLVFIFLSNRIYPDGRDLFLKMNIRPKIFEAVYQALIR